MLVYYFVPFIVSNRYLLFRDSNGHNSVTIQNRTHVYMNFFDHKDLGNHLLQLCPKVVKHPVYNVSSKTSFFYQTSRNKKLKECNVLQGKCTILFHFSDQLWYFNPKQLFHNISITKTTNAYFKGNPGRYHFRAKENLINYKS